MLLRQKTSWIDEANEKINIIDVLTLIGVFVPTNISEGANKKIHCPFGFYHSDGGLSKAMRVYLSSNTVYCFSCSKRYSSVTLAAAAWDCSLIAASLRLLEDSGYKPKTVEQRWQEAIAVEEVQIDTLALVDALKIYCAGICKTWNTSQLDDNIAELLNRCLSLTDAIKTDEQAEKWLSVCKQAMRTALVKE